MPPGEWVGGGTSPSPLVLKKAPAGKVGKMVPMTGHLGPGQRSKAKPLDNLKVPFASYSLNCNSLSIL